MKKIFILLLIIFPSIVSASTIVMDIDTKRVIYEENMNKKDLIASTTKILTSLVVINNVKNLDKKIEVDKEVLKAYGSNIYIEIGEKISIRDLLYGLLMRSGNDAALVLANYVGGSMEGFSILMNEQAKSIGMYNSNFINASGLEEKDGKGNISTPYDMALLSSYVYKNKTLMKIMSTKKHTVKTNYKTYIWTNKNKLLFSYKYTTGGKTGYTKKAYRTLVTTASKNNMNLTIVTLREKDDFNKHKKLYEQIFSKYKKFKILSKKLGNNRCLKDDVYLLLNKEEKNKIKINLVTTKDIYDRIGYINILLDNKIINKYNVYKCKEDT